MTLSELAEFVTVKVNQTEPEDVAACKEFLKRRHEMIWNDQLWKDSLVEYVQTISNLNYTKTSTWLPTKKILLAPPELATILAIRTDTKKLSVQRSEFYYRRDFDTFGSGDASIAEFVLLSPCVWELDTGSDGYFQVYAGADETFTLNYRYTDADQITEINYATAFNADVYPNFGNINSSTACRLASFGKVASTNYLWFVVDGAALNLVLAPTDIAAPLRQRIYFAGGIEEGAVLRILAKRKVPVFESDNDAPSISGIDNCLLTFAQADMLERERHYGQAKLIMDEAQLLAEQLKKIEVVQQAHYQRIIPEGGYAQDYQTYSPPLQF